MILENKTFLVYGAGKSGLSAYEYLKRNNAKVYIYADKFKEKIEGFNHIVKFSEVLKMKFDYIVVSPGITIIGNQNIKKLKQNGSVLISELELGYLACKGKFIAVTGTNGKTTCVNLIYHVLKNSHKAFLCGNMGVPITSICDSTDENSVVICEVSSFMLELVSCNFSPDISVLLNITPDHISRHKSLQEYYKTKLNITNYQSEKGILLVPPEFADEQTKATKLVIFNKKQYKTHLIGDFNMQNIAFCEKVCELLNVKNKTFRKYLKTFYPIDFRLQYIGKKRKVTYINDSKSTNPDSTIKALSGMKKKVILLLGGSDKGNSFTQIFEQKDKIKLALIYGQTANIIESDALFKGFSNISKFGNLNEVLNNLNQFVKRGDTILFSPACASYDEFKNYIERGKFFNAYVDSL